MNKKLLAPIIMLMIILATGCSLPSFEEISGGTGGTASAGETTEFTLNVNIASDELYSFEDVTLKNIKFSYIADLKIDIVSPEGTVFSLVNTNAIRHFDGTYTIIGSTAMGDYSTIEDADQAGLGSGEVLNTITDGTFQAAASFSAAEGENPNGTWTLKITNNHEYRDCTIDGFSMTIGYNA